MIKIEVAYATVDKQTIVACEVEEGTSLLDAALQSGIDKEFTDLDIAKTPMGLYGRKVPKPAQQTVNEGDRIELYRPLLVDPKQARLNRANKTKKEQESP